MAVTVAFLAVSVTDPQPSSATGYLQAALEASMIGGLADWFAVVAIFRRPLGLPLPHVAVIVERKDAFGRTLGEFIQENLLEASAVLERIEQRRLIPRTAEWLSDPVNAERAAGHVVGLLATLPDMVGDEDLHRLLEREFTRAVDAVPLAPLAGRTLRTLAAGGRDTHLLDAAIPLIEQLMNDHRVALRVHFAEDAPWWVPKGVERRIFDRIFDGLKDVIGEAKADPDHELRLRLRTMVSGLADQLETSPELLARGEELKHQLLADPGLRSATASLGARAREALKHRAGEPELRQAVAGMVVTAGRRLASDAELQAQAQRIIETATRRAAERFGDDIAGLVAAQINRWDAAETARKLELLLGRDLQFIRINGTVVGGLAGVVIHAAAQAVG